METQRQIQLETRRPTSPRSPRRHSRFALSRVLPPLVSGVLIVAVFEVAHRVEIIPAVLLPSPASVGEEMVQLAVSGFFWSNLWVTLQEALLGFAFGSLIGLVLGVAVGVSSLVARALYPYVVLVQAMPRVALAPVFIAVLGFGMASKVMTAIVICFFPVFINTLVGLQQVDENALSLMRSLRASRMQIFRKLQFPGALPVIFGGLKTAMTLAFIGAIVGELSAANAGVALLIEAAAFQLRMDAVFAAILWLAVVALVLFGVMEVLDRRIVFWRPRETRGTRGGAR